MLCWREDVSNDLREGYKAVSVRGGRHHKQTWGHVAAHSCRYRANAVFFLYYVLVQLSWLTSQAQRRDLQKENPVKT